MLRSGSSLGGGKRQNYSFGASRPYKPVAAFSQSVSVHTNLRTCPVLRPVSYSVSPFSKASRNASAEKERCFSVCRSPDFFSLSTFSNKNMLPYKPLLFRPSIRSLLFLRHAVQRHRSNTSSINPTEINHFNALASSWWDARGPSRLLHLMNPLRHTFINSCLNSQSTPAPTNPLKYLDVGCGGGIFAESAARLLNTASVTAIDPSEEVLAVAKSHARRDPLLMQPGRLNYLNTCIEDLPLPAKPEDGADVLTLFEVLEHVAQPAQFLEQLLPHVRPGGWIILSTIARTWTSWVTTKVLAEDVLRLVPRGTHDWAKFVDEVEIRNWFMRRGGWDTPRAMGVVYLPGIGWKEIIKSEAWGNYFFGVRKNIL